MFSTTHTHTHTIHKTNCSRPSFFQRICRPKVIIREPAPSFFSWRNSPTHIHHHHRIHHHIPYATKSITFQENPVLTSLVALIILAIFAACVIVPFLAGPVSVASISTFSTASVVVVSGGVATYYYN